MCNRSRCSKKGAKPLSLRWTTDLLVKTQGMHGIVLCLEKESSTLQSPCPCERIISYSREAFFFCKMSMEIRKGKHTENLQQKFAKIADFCCTTTGPNHYHDEIGSRLSQRLRGRSHRAQPAAAAAPLAVNSSTSRHAL